MVIGVVKYDGSLRVAMVAEVEWGTRPYPPRSSSQALLLWSEYCGSIVRLPHLTTGRGPWRVPPASRKIGPWGKDQE
jgi:hypothetical protein